MGLLVMVFAPLDALFAERNVDAGVIVAITVGGLMFVVCGIVIQEWE